MKDGIKAERDGVVSDDDVETSLSERIEELQKKGFTENAASIIAIGES